MDYNPLHPDLYPPMASPVASYRARIQSKRVYPVSGSALLQRVGKAFPEVFVSLHYDKYEGLENAGSACRRRGS